MKRADWLKQKREEFELWIAHHRQIGNITLLGIVEERYKQRIIAWRCSCGAEGQSRWTDLQEDVKRNPELRSCKSCSQRIKMRALLENPETKGRILEQLLQASEKAAQLNLTHTEKRYELIHPKKQKENQAFRVVRPKDYIETHLGCSREDFISVRNRFSGAKARCENPNHIAYKDYGGRGIEFRFSSPSEAAEWMILNVGLPDFEKGSISIDRIDNNRHYEPGNLRWATREEQANNKRRYVVRGIVGERIRKLKDLGVDYHYETLRGLIKQGLTDEEILTKTKWSGCGQYQRKKN